MNRLVTPRMRAVVRRRVELAMGSTVRVLRPSDPVLNPTSLRVTAGSVALVYEGKARIRDVQGSTTLMVGEGELPQRATIISIPWDSPLPRVEDIVVVDVAGEDADLQGRAFVVGAVDGGGLFHDARRMTVTAYTESRWWE